MPTKKLPPHISPSNRYINIKAVSDCMTVIETVPEERAVKRLEAIRRAHMWYINRSGVDPGTLRVNTVLANPELQFN